jgi:DNA-binding CsgD family transcriptional regulator
MVERRLVRLTSPEPKVQPIDLRTVNDLRIESKFHALSRGEGHRRTRKKRHIAWEQAELASGGLYARYLNEIAHHYPQLTQSERRVAALVKALLPNWRIGEILGITEKAVENYRVKIRRKIGCCDSRLDAFLEKI